MAAILAVGLFVGSWFVTDPWPGTPRLVLRDVMDGAAVVLWLTALILGIVGWRKTVAGKVAIAVAIGVPALTLFFLATANFQ